MNDSIYSFDKEIRCDYCEHFDEESKGENLCKLNLTPKGCEKFKYDVFKRKPRRTPQLSQFDYDDFSLE